MNWPFVVYLLLGEALAFLGVCAWAWRHRAVPVAKPLSGLALASAIYVGAFALELPGGSLLWLRRVVAVEYIGISFLPTLILYVFADFTGWNAWLTRRVRLALGAFSAVSVILKSTDSYHGLIYQNLATMRQGSLSINVFDHGFWYWLLIAYLQLALLFGFVASIRAWREANPFFRNQLAAVGLASVAPWLANLLYLSGWSPWGRLDLSPFALLATVSLLTWAIFRTRFSSVTPIARNQLVEMLRDGVVVVDSARVVVDMNPAAMRMLQLSERIFGTAAANALRPWPTLLALIASSQETHQELQSETNKQVFWSVGWYPVSTQGKRPRGFMLVLRDISERKRNERQMQELLINRTQQWREATAAALQAAEEEERKIGRELHDTLCQELIGLSRQAESLALSRPSADHCSEELVTKLQWVAKQAAATARQARDISHLLAGTELAELTLEETIRYHLSRQEISLALVADLTFDNSFPTLPSDQRSHVARIIREAVANAARHGRARQVWVDCVRKGNRALISVSNDGDHSHPPQGWREGLGLRQMRMRANLLGGELSFRSGEKSGAVVELSLPCPDHEHTTNDSPADIDPSSAGGRSSCDA